MRQQAAPELARRALARALVAPAMVRPEAWRQPAAPSVPQPGQPKHEGQKATTGRPCQPARHQLTAGKTASQNIVIGEWNVDIR
jgi:hypothetical protein